ncbi:MAG TPA: protein kinase [Planctomycetota bacterium]|nr:protein kinase [Planctomycetota bacterium]
MLSPPACPACGDHLPPAAQFCPGCGRPIKPLKGSHESGIGPRTDQPLIAAQPGTDTQVDIAEVAQFLPQRYQPVKKLGQGGMGTVYHCIDKALERAVAIKIMTDRYRSDPQGERRFMREARAQAIVNHPNVATILNFGISPEGRPFLVMEYLEGRDLRSIIREEKILDPMRACDILKQVCDGLHEAHSAGLVHRDLKPSNIMMVKDHRGSSWVKILDLGLAKIVGGQTDLKSISMDTAGMLVGTPAYMSPEQVAGASVDGRADLYSLGIVFYELLTGRLPFESETMEGWLYQHLHTKPPPPSQFNRELLKIPSLDRLTLWMMAKNPNDRPSSAGELGAFVKRLIERRLLDDAMARPARKSGPRPAMPFEENPGARKSGPRANVTFIDAPPPPPDWGAAPLVQEAPPPATGQAMAEVEQRREAYLQISKMAETAESQRHWQGALDLWQQALPLADRAETVNARIQGCRREMDFEEQLSAADKAADNGEWEVAEKTLSRLFQQRSMDTRLEQTRALLPRRLVAAWMNLSRSKVLPMPEGDLRQALLERLGIAFAQAGDMKSSLLMLHDPSRKSEARVTGVAQAIAAAIQNDMNEGLRPYLDQLAKAANELVDPSERGRAQVEVARAMTAYGDETAAALAFKNALSAFSEANSKGIPIQAPVKRQNSTSFRRLSVDMRSFMATTTSLSGAKAMRASFEAALGAVAQAQAEAGLVDDSLATTALIDDAWTLAHTLSQVAQAFAKIGRTADAEKVTAKIGFALPKTQALRALAVSRVYCGDLNGADDILKTIAAAADRIALQGLLAAAWALRNEAGRSQVRVGEAVKCVADVVGARARFQALLSGAEPLLKSGFHELAQPIVTESAKLIDLMDDPAERLRSMLQLAQVQENARSARLAATRTIMVQHQPSSTYVDFLRRGLVVWRQVRQNADRMECVEKLAHSISWGNAPELATEVLTTCRDNAELALAYIGLSTGMA